MRRTAASLVLFGSLLLAGCAGTPVQHPQLAEAGTSTGSHIAGVTPTGPMTVVGRDQLDRQPLDTGFALEHSSASPYLSDR